LNILFTGASGFLGRALISALAVEDNSIYALIRNKTNPINLPPISEKIKYINVEQINIKDTFKKIKLDLVLHAATNYGRNNSHDEVASANYLLPSSLLDLAIKFNVSRFYNIDTYYNLDGLDYGHFIDYIKTKKDFQKKGVDYSRNGEITFLNFKLYHLYGPGDSDDKFIPQIILKCLSGEHIYLESGLQYRDFVYLDDVVEAIKVSTKINFSPGYHDLSIKSGKVFSIINVVNIINKLCGNRSKINLNGRHMRSGEFSVVSGDPADMKRLGIKCCVDLEARLASLIDLYKSQNGLML